MDYNLNSVIYVKPVRKTSAQGRDVANLDTPQGQSYIRGFHKASGIEMPICFITDPTTGERITGLNELIDNPYEGVSDYSEIPSHWVDEVKAKWSKERLIPIQTYLEIKWKLKNNSLTYYSQTKTMVQLNQHPNEFNTIRPNLIDSFEKYLSYETDTNIVDPSKSLEEALLYMAVMNSRLIAPNIEEVNLDEHDFYISTVKFDEVKATNRTKLAKVVTGQLLKLEEEHTISTRYMFAVVLFLTSDTETIDSVIINALNNFVYEPNSTNLGGLEQRLRRFNIVYETYIKSNIDFMLEYMVTSAANVGVIKSEGIDLIWATRSLDDNRRKLGNDRRVVLKKFKDAYSKYDPTIDDNNAYGLLLGDLKARNVPLP